MNDEDICKAVTELPIWVKLLIPIAWQSVETWLGKTDKVKAGSIPELVLNGLKKALTKGKKNGRE